MSNQSRQPNDTEQAPFPKETMHTIMCDIGIQQLFTQTLGRTPIIIEGVINDPEYEDFKASFLYENDIEGTPQIEMGTELSQQLGNACIDYINASLPDTFQIPTGTASNIVLDILSKL